MNSFSSFALEDIIIWKYYTLSRKYYKILSAQLKMRKVKAEVKAK